MRVHQRRVGIVSHHRRAGVDSESASTWPVRSRMRPRGSTRRSAATRGLAGVLAEVDGAPDLPVAERHGDDAEADQQHQRRAADVGAQIVKHAPAWRSSCEIRSSSPTIRKLATTELPP